METQHNKLHALFCKRNFDRLWKKAGQTKEQTKRILPAYKNVIKTLINLEENKGKLWKAIVALCVVFLFRETVVKNELCSEKRITRFLIAYLTSNVD